MTMGLVTPGYEAPEAFPAAADHYSLPVDVWSLGCIMGELFFRKVMFETETTGDLAMVRFKAGWPPELPELPPQVIKHPRLSSSQTSLTASRAATAQGPPDLQLLSSLSGQHRLPERGRRALSPMS